MKNQPFNKGRGYLPDRDQSGKARQIPLNDRLGEVFKEVRRGKHLKSPHVFCDSQGRGFLEVKRSFASACRKAGIEAFRFHGLRPTERELFLLL